MQQIRRLIPRTISVGIDSTRLFPEAGSVECVWIAVELVSLGSATVVKIGDSVTTGLEMIAVGDTYSDSVEGGYWMDATEICGVSDATDPENLPVVRCMGGFCEEAREWLH